MLELNNNQLYKEIIMEHYKNPKNTSLKSDLKTWEAKNPVCGDGVLVQIEVNGQKQIVAVNQKCLGCIVSTASASIMSELLVGKTLKQAKEIVSNFVKMVKGETVPHKESLAEAVVFEGVASYPARFKCATISWEALYKAIDELEN